MDKNTDERFIALETKLAFLEDFVNKLQQETVEQAKNLNILTAENRMISGKLHDLLDLLEDIPNRKPPHY